MMGLLLLCKANNLSSCLSSDRYIGMLSAGRPPFPSRKSVSDLVRISEKTEVELKPNHRSKEVEFNSPMVRASRFQVRVLCMQLWPAIPLKLDESTKHIWGLVNVWLVHGFIISFLILDQCFNECFNQWTPIPNPIRFFPKFSRKLQMETDISYPHISGRFFPIFASSSMDCISSRHFTAANVPCIASCATSATAALLQSCSGASRSPVRPGCSDAHWRGPGPGGPVVSQGSQGSQE